MRSPALDEGLLKKKSLNLSNALFGSIILCKSVKMHRKRSAEHFFISSLRYQKKLGMEFSLDGANSFVIVACTKTGLSEFLYLLSCHI